MNARRLAGALSWAVGLGAMAQPVATALAVPPVVTPSVQDATQEVPIAEIGTPLELTLTPRSTTEPPIQQFTLVAAADGALTVDASSYDADVVLARIGADGSVLARADAGGIGWNARLVLDAKSGELVRLGVAFPEPIAGRVVVRVAAGEAPLPTGFALAEATAEFHYECGLAAQARGDTGFAIKQYHESGQSYFHLQLFADSQRAYRACLPLAEETGNALAVIFAQGYLGAAAVRFGSASEARDLLVPACAGAAAQQQPVFEMFCQANLGDACRQLGDLVAARVACDRALAMARETKDPGFEASMLSQSAMLAVEEGDAESAREQHEQAVRAMRGLGDPNRLAQLLELEADYHRQRGELDLAEQGLLEAVEQATLPAIRASALRGLGNVRTAQGRWTEARVLYQDALDIGRELGDEALQSTALGNLGVVEGRAGDLSGADAHLKQALALHDQFDNAGAKVQVLLELANLRYEEDRLPESKGFLEQAQAIAEASALDELSIRVLHQLARLASRDPSRLDEGGKLAESMLELARRSGSADGETEALTMLAWIRHLQGRNDEARTVVAEAVAASLGAEPHLAAAALSTQIDIALVRRDLVTAQSALTAARAMLSGLSLGQMDTEGGSLARSSWSFAQFAELEQDVLALSLATPSAERGPASKPENRAALIAGGFRAAGRAQARALLEGIAEHRSGHRDERAVALRRDWRRLLADREAALDALAASRRDGSSAAASEPQRARAQELAAQADAVLADLRRIAPQEAALDVPPELDPAQVQRDLLEGADVLVQYAEGQEQLYAYVLTKDSVEWHELGARADIGAQAREYLDGISDPTRLASPGAVAVAGAQVWRALLEPLLPAGAWGRLIVVPTPSLAGLPFEALVTEGAPTAESCKDLQFVIDRYDVVYVPSPAVMSLLAAVPARSGAPRMLVLADPVVPGEALAPNPVPRQINESVAWARLPGTRTEAMGIVDLLHAAVAGTRPEGPRALPADERGGHLQSDLVDVYLGQEATVARLRDGARRYSIVHLAAHGAVDATEPQRSGLLLSATAEDDGFLSVPEVLELDLDADLVVLSACDTARGAVRRGEGVQSLARAFLYAGAREVIATLWQVDDRETEVAMRSLYRGMQEDGLSTSAALRQARLELRNARAEDGGFAGTGRGELLPGAPPRASRATDRPQDLSGHPYFWAPFIAIGWSARSR